MQCKDVQNKFIPFINDELNQKELKEFLGHIHQCKTVMKNMISIIL